MRANLGVVVVSVGLLLAAIPVQAHHSLASEFDSKKLLKLRGTVTKMDWVNPHAWIYIDVQNPDGSVTSWMIEAGSPNVLLRRGFNKNSLPPGTEIYVEAFQAKDAANRANGQVLTFADGKKLFLGTAGNEGAPETAK
jgi:Family of unknown function (DUF6152)